jgi:hypothetical protein
MKSLHINDLPADYSARKGVSVQSLFFWSSESARSLLALTAEWESQLQTPLP